MADVFGEFSKAAGGAVSDALTAAIQPKLDAITFQVRQELARRRKVQPNQISDLEVAQFILVMPSAELGVKVEYIGQTVRNGVLIGCGVIALAILISGLIRRPR